MSDEIWYGLVWGVVGSAAIVLGTLSAGVVIRSLSTSGERPLAASLSVSALDPTTLAVLVALLALVVGLSIVGRR